MFHVAPRLAVFTAGALALIAASAPAHAQRPIGNEPVASILTWTPRQQLERYPAIEKVYRTETVRKGDTVRELPLSSLQVDPRITHAGRTQSLDAFMTANRITGLIALKDGEVILERYALGRKPEDRWTSFSVAKSITSTLVGAAIKDRWIRSAFDPVTLYIPELRGTAYDEVLLHHLLTMSSGVKWNEDYANPRSDVARASQQPASGSTNPLVRYMAGLERETRPGAKFNYNTGETDLVGIALSRALAGKSLSQYLSEKIWAPYGMEQDAIWMTDGAGHERGGCCISMTLRDYARFGQFMMDGGVIDGESILPDGWLRQATRNRLTVPASANGASYGYFWWPFDDGFEARGVFGQGIAVFPEENLVIAINSAMPRASDRRQSEARTAVFNAIRDAAKGVS